MITRKQLERIEGSTSSSTEAMLLSESASTIRTLVGIVEKVAEANVIDGLEEYCVFSGCLGGQDTRILPHIDACPYREAQEFMDSFNK